MTQKISYQVRIGVPTELENRERMLVSVDSLLRAFEKIDRLIVNSMGMELNYKRVLGEMGAAYFDYEVMLILAWPVQMQLGSSPKSASINLIIGQVHQDLLKSLRFDSADASEITHNWDTWARKEGLADSLLYLAPSAKSFQPLLDDFCSAAHNLDDRIVLS